MDESDIAAAVEESVTKDAVEVIPSNNEGEQEVIGVDLSTEPDQTCTVLANLKTGEITPVGNISQVIVPGSDNRILIPVDAKTAVALSPKEVAHVLCPGLPELEAIRLLMVCRSSGVNPFTEVHIDKRRNDRGGFDYNFITSKKAYFRLASEHPDYRGYEYKDYPEEDGTGKEVLWGECTPYRDGCHTSPLRLSYQEAIQGVGKGGAVVQRKGYCTAQPRHYLKLVVCARALRDCFPDRLGNLYVKEELVDD